MGTWTLRRDGDTSNPTLVRPYGKQSTNGLLAYYEKQGNQTAFILLLSTGGKYGCDGIDKVYYGAGFELTQYNAQTGARQWRFHPGTRSTGWADPLQGRPEFFPTLDHAFSGISYIEIKLPPELSEGTEEPNKVTVYMRCLKVMDFTVGANNRLVPTGTAIFSSSNALVGLDVLIECQKMALTRFHAASFITDYKPRCAAGIPWDQGGTTVTTTRFTADVAFDGQDAMTAFDAIVRLSPGCDWQDVADDQDSYRCKIKMLVTPNRASVHNFTYDRSQTAKLTNILDPFSVSPKALKKLANYYIYTYRDKDDPFFKTKYAIADRPELRQLAGGKPVVATAQLGVCTQSQAERIVETEARLNSDLAFFVPVTALKDSLHVAKADVVTLSHEEIGVTEANAIELMVNDERFLGLKTADERYFLLQKYVPNYYSDTDHGPVQASIFSDIQSNYVAPPIVTSVALTEGARVLGDETYVPTIKIAVQFSLTYGYRQRGRLWVKRPGEGSYTMLADRVIEPHLDTRQAAIEIDAAIVGTHFIKVVPETYAGVKIEPLTSHTPYSIPVTGKTAAPGDVTGLSATADPTYSVLTLKWSLPADNDIKRIKIYTSSGGVDTFIGNAGADATSFNPPLPSTGTTTFKVVVMNRSNVTSAGITVAFSAITPGAGSFSNMSIGGEYDVNGAYLSRIFGRFTFPSFAYAMRGRIYLTPPGGVERDTGRFLYGLSGAVVNFFLDAEGLGNHTLRIVTEVTATGQSNSGITHASVTVNVTEPVITLPNASAVTWIQNGSRRSYSITPPVLKSDQRKIVGYEIWTQNPASTAETLLTRGPELNQLVDFALLAAALETRDWGYRSYDEMGNHSPFTWVAYFQYKSFGTLGLSKDTTLDEPNAVNCLLSKVGGTVEGDVQYTVIQTRTPGMPWPSGNQDNGAAAFTPYNIPGQQVYDGDQMSLPAIGKLGSTVEIRAGKILFAGTQFWSVAVTHTFTDPNKIQKRVSVGPFSFSLSSIATQTAAITGARVGDTVVATPENGLVNGTIYGGAWVSDVDQVSVKLLTDGTVLSASAAPWLFDVIKHPSSLYNALVANLRLGEVSGTRFDIFGANHLTDNDTVTQATGKIGYAAQFTAANSEYLSISDNSSLSSENTSFSITGWVYLDSKGSIRTIAAKRNALNDGEFTLIYDSGADRFALYIFDGSTTAQGVNADALGSPALSTWYFIRAWADVATGKINIQVNNGTINQATKSITVPDTTAGFKIGAQGSTPSFFWDGRINALKFWKKALTPSEATDLYTKENGGEYLI